MFLVKWEQYDRGQWSLQQCVVAAIDYDRNDAHMLTLHLSSASIAYHNPVRNILVESIDHEDQLASVKDID